MDPRIDMLSDHDDRRVTITLSPGILKHPKIEITTHSRTLTILRSLLLF